MSHRFDAPDGRRLAYEDSGGPGAPVLCLAGLTRNSRDFAPLAEHLAPRYRVIRLDSRGHGASDHARVPETEYTVEVEARDAAALCDRLGLPRVAVIGTSRGGMQGMAMAASRPELVSGLVLNDVGATIEGAGLSRLRTMLGATPPPFPDHESAARLLMAAGSRDFPGVLPEEWLRHAHAIFDRPDPAGPLRLAFDPALGPVIAATIDPADPEIDLWPLFSTLNGLPVLVLRGENSDILSRATVARMARGHTPFTAVEIPDRGHTPFLTEPAALGAIDAFLAAHAPKDPP